MMIIDYEISKECKNIATYYTCYKCGKCGRKFVNGYMVDDNYNIVDRGDEE